jgi:hypothetical protein
MIVNSEQANKDEQMSKELIEAVRSGDVDNA